MSLKPSVIVDLKMNPESVRDALQTVFHGREVINLADDTATPQAVSDAAYAVVWKPSADLFQRATGLKVVFSGGAGVDHVLKLPGLPDAPLVRFVDPTLTTRMSEWVVMQCLMHLRQHATYQAQARQREWNERAQPEAREVTVGVMGLGVLGQDAARKLQIMGFKVIGWSRTRKSIDTMDTYDQSGLDVFLARTDILVGLLPLTAETTGIFDASLFAKLNKSGPLGGPVFVNGGRGGSQVDCDIVAALDNGTLKGASLDVFEQEPLPRNSVLWGYDQVYITPHAAAASDVHALFRHVSRQIDRFENGLPLEHVVDREIGY